jgi:hypothetical protein
MASAYLTVLERARLLPCWAAPRRSDGDRASYTSDPGGISGGPIVLRRSRKRHPLTLVIGLLALAFCVLAALPRASIIAVVGGWGAPYTLELGPTAEEPAPVFEESSPRWLGPASSPALAQRDAERPEVARLPAPARKTLQHHFYDGGATPASSSDDPGKSLTRERPSHQTPGFNAQFGI